MPWRVVFFALGVFLLQQQAVLPAPTFLWELSLAGLLLLLAGRGRWHFLALLGAALLGFAWAGGFAQLRLADELPAASEGREIEMTGVITGMPQRFERGVRFVFAVERSDAPVPSRIALNWYRQADAVPEELADESGEEFATAGSLPLPHAGERWRLRVRLKRPHGSVNPHGFDYEGWLFERGIRATGYVRKADINARLDAQTAGLGSQLERWREATRARILRALPEQPFAGVLAALAVGDQQAIAPDLWRLFAATGITHLMSISGLHVTMIGAILGWLAGVAWRRSARLPLLWPAQKAAAVAGFLGAFLYALLAGFGVPAQRTLYMLGVVVVALLSGRAVAAPHILGAALLLVLLIDPWAVLAPGFWLSFGAVALLFFIGNGRTGRPHWLAEWGRTQWALTLGMIPALLALFQQFSLVSPLANAIAIPVVSFLVTPLALLGCVPGLAFALEIAHWILVGLMGFLQALAGVSGAVWQQHAPPAWAVPLALLGVAWLFLPRGFLARWLGLVTFLPLFLIPPDRPAQGALKIVVLDVGQGEAVHVQTATHDLLFDAGSAFNAVADSGNRILVPYLRAVGVQRLDTLIVSHADQDHAGGAASLLASLPVDAFLTSIPATHLLLQKSALAGRQSARQCEEGKSWEWDGVRFRLLHPVAADYDRKLPTNAMSCVLKIESRHGRVLIPGDLEGAAETALLARHGGEDSVDVRADILVAPHHGGRRTSSSAFVAAVGAREVVFPVGYRNRFGHPWPEVLARYQATAARIHRTDGAGAVTLNLDENGVQISHEREQERRYWHNPTFTIFQDTP